MTETENGGVKMDVSRANLAQDACPEEPRTTKRRRSSGKDEQEERLELKLAALQAECQRTESERSRLEKHRKAIHASYCILLALVLLAALIVVPKLQRRSYLQGYDEGVRQSARSQEKQPQPSEPSEQREQPPVSADVGAADAETRPDVTEYIGNKKSKKFHLPTCTGLPKESNRVFFESREEALEEGYTPCSICNP